MFENVHGYYLKLIPHCVVMADGRVLDVTPQVDEARILFLPDDRVIPLAGGMILPLSTTVEGQRVIKSVMAMTELEAQFRRMCCDMLLGRV